MSVIESIFAGIGALTVGVFLGRFIVLVISALKGK